MPHLVMQELKAKPLVFMGSSRKDLRGLPKTVRINIGVDLYAVQCGKTPESAKSFKGLKGVMEIVERYTSDTYRAVYVAAFGKKVYVLHCFKKKSKSGVKTPRKDIDIIKQRYKEAKALVK